MDELLGWIGLIVVVVLLVYGIPVLGNAGQGLLVGTEFVAYGLSCFGVANPMVAWIVLGILLGAAAGFAVGFGRAGRKLEMVCAGVLVPVFVIVLSVLSQGAPKPESPQEKTARTTLAALIASAGDGSRWSGIVGSDRAVLQIVASPGSTIMSGTLKYDDFVEDLSIYVRPGGSVVMQATNLRRLKGKRSFALGTFQGTLTPDKLTLEGVYSLPTGMRGRWRLVR